MSDHVWSKRQADLLVKSIIKWETKGIWDICPLCSEYFIDMCGGCPLYILSGEQNCTGDGNPYWKIFNTARSINNNELTPAQRKQMTRYLIRVLEAGGWEVGKDDE
jgi:hypothetical protein